MWFHHFLLFFPSSKPSHIAPRVVFFFIFPIFIIIVTYVCVCVSTYINATCSLCMIYLHVYIFRTDYVVVASQLIFSLFYQKMERILV